MLLVCLIWGANFTITKLAFAELSPLAFTALRFAAGSLCLWALVRLTEGPGPAPRGALLRDLIWIGIFGNTLYQIGFVFGLLHSTATNTSLILAASPAVVAVFAAALGHERTSWPARIGIALGIGGVAVVVLARAGAARLQISHGDLFTVGALLSWAIYTVALRRIHGLSPLRITAWATYTGTPGLVLAGIPHLVNTRWSGVGPGVWVALAYAVLLSLILGYVIWNRSVRAVGATRTAIYMCVTPLFAVLIAWAFLAERPGALHLIGGLLIVVGVTLTRLSQPRQEAPDRPEA
jgi:drug/metabolite transporter (DMT)-like permease